jgi:hypothetical protein
MTMLRKSLPVLLLALSFGAAQAETLLIDGVEQEAATRSERPSRGVTKAQVEARFGQPTRMVAAVGEPPISRWEYPGFVVYFEYDRVIHAVPRR